MDKKGKSLLGVNASTAWRFMQVLRIVHVVVITLTVAVVSSVSFAGHHEKEEWPWPSKWGPDDTLGSVNQITPEVILNAASMIRIGKRYPLGVVTGPNTPAVSWRTFKLYAVGHGDGSGVPIGSNKMTYNDDWMLAWMGIGSQIDGLGHVGQDHVYFNGHKVQDFFASGGLKKFATHEIPPIVARGVVLDVLGYMKESSPQSVRTVQGKLMLKKGTAINQKEIDGAVLRQGINLGKDDVVLLHTGYLALGDIDPESYMSGLPGLGVEGARYLGNMGVIAVGADTYALEVIPFEEKGTAYPVHIELLTKRGIYILENMNTHELVADRAWEFMFVLGQPRFEGAVQAIINPVAIR